MAPHGGRARVLAHLTFCGDDRFQILAFATLLSTIAVAHTSYLLRLIYGGLLDVTSIHIVVMRSGVNRVEQIVKPEFGISAFQCWIAPH